MKVQIGIILWFALFCFSPQVEAAAQDEVSGGAVYVVKPGDTLWGISRTFNVSLDDLAAFNDIADPSQISVGQRLGIPGLEEVQGVLVVGSIPYGENLQSLSRRYRIPYDIFARLNRFTSPQEVAAGSTLITIDQDDEFALPSGGRVILRSGISLFELAVSQNENPWVLSLENGLQGTRDVLPGEVLHRSNSDDPGPGALPEVIESVTMKPSTAIQGKTLVFQVSASNTISLTGTIADLPLHFFPQEQGMVALQGIHAMMEPGYYSTTLAGVLDDGTEVKFFQKVYIQDGGYAFDPPLVVNSETIDVENTQPEDFEWLTVVAPVNPERYWSDIFLPPVPKELAECYPSIFGNRRSYNGSAYQYFHTGLDFCGRTGVEIYAAAPGRVVFADSLVVRGMATVIDHGWGVYTAYAHQSEILVAVGDWVEAGQLIGLVGETGRVTGPHLHWEVIVGGIQVDPMDWLVNLYP